jgi:hypothetical protein
MTVHREWVHALVLAPFSVGSPPNVAWVQGSQVPGNVVVSGGGHAEYVNSDGSNESSTDTTGNTASLPIAGIRTIYDAVGDYTSILVGFRCEVSTKVRAHVFTTWEA